MIKRTPSGFRVASHVLVAFFSLSFPVSSIADPPEQNQAGIAFSYQLPSNSRTSAGVFDDSGVLIRTLWSNKSQGAGTYTNAWDGKNDAGSEAPSQSTYTIKVLHSNASYTWDGVIGNTETSWGTSTDIWDGLAYVPSTLRLAFAGNLIWIATGYSEGTFNLLSLDASKPNTPRVANRKFAQQEVLFIDIDTDGSYLYLPNAAVWSGENFITKFDVHSGTPASFSQGATISHPYSWKGIDMNGIDVSAKGSASPTSIAVQNSGQILAVGYPTSNTVKFFDKTTGAIYGSPVSIASPQSMGFTSEGLWVLSDSKVYLVSDPGRANHLTMPLAGLANPVYVTSNKANNHVFVLDGGSSQQVKEFDSAHALVRTYGDAGGYTDWNPTITNSRLMLDNTATKGVGSTNGSWLRVSPNNELWLCDGGNASRILHISAANTYINRILFSQETYTVAVSQTSPTRVFRGTIEYTIDYSKPLRPGDPDPALGGNGAWKMVRNWAVGAEGANGSNPHTFNAFEASQGILYAEKLSNGRTYAQVRDKGEIFEVELPNSGTVPMRFISSTNSAGLPLQTDGSVLKETISRATSNTTVTIQRAPLTGFDSSNNPIRGPFTTVLSMSFDSANVPTPSYGGWGMVNNFQPTSSGVYPVWESTSRGIAGFPHLAGVVAGRSSYLFLTNREGCISHPDFAGTFPCGNGYGGHAGIGTQAVGNNIFAAYDGQYATYGSTFYHYWTDGLMVGQYGQLVIVPTEQPRPPGSAGNIAMTRFAPANGDVYMYLTVEAGYTPVQRWRISNLGSIVEAVGSAPIGGSVELRVPASNK